MELEKREEYEEPEVICGDCIGQMTIVQVQRTTFKLFTPVYFRKVVLHCNFCNKISKPFTQRIKKQQ